MRKGKKDSDTTAIKSEMQTVGIDTGAFNRFPRLDAVLASVTEIPAAVLVVTEIVVLFAGVVSRYVFNRPLTWSDELASVLFLWLAMTGAVIALRRQEHMRLTAVVAIARPALRRWWDTFAAVVVALFVVEIIPPAREYFINQWDITTPALEIHDGFRVAAIGIGASLMIVIAISRLIESYTLRNKLGPLANVVKICAGLWLLNHELI